MSLLFSFIFSLLVFSRSSPLSIFHLLSSLFSLLSCLVSSVSSSLVFLSCLVFSYLVLFCFLLSSLLLSLLCRLLFSLSLSLCASVSVSVCLRVLLWSSRCVVSCVVVCVCVVVVLWRCGVSIQKPSVSIQSVPVCTFKTLPCVPAPRAHVFQHARVLKAHTEAFLTYIRARF